MSRAEIKAAYKQVITGMITQSQLEPLDYDIHYEIAHLIDKYKEDRDIIIEVKDELIGPRGWNL